MAVDLLGRFSGTLSDQAALQEAATAGLKSMEHIIHLVSQQKQAHQQIQTKELVNFTGSLKKAISTTSNRSGHARFRRGPSVQQPINQTPPPSTSSAPPKQTQLTPTTAVTPKPLNLDFSKAAMNMKTCGSYSTTSSSFLSSVVTGEGSLSAGKSLEAAKRCREHEIPGSISGKSSNSKNCHCKRRKNKMKTTMRVPAASSKVADIPPDEYSWRKYGHKPIKGSHFPRGYYKCSMVRGCPARKHVERATDDSTMFIVTYKDQHIHTQSPAMQEIPAPLNYGTLMVFDSPTC